jgi:hypothetical protein
LTRSIEDTPVLERRLYVESRASEAAINAVRAGLPQQLGTNEIVVFLTYSYADVPVGTEFDCCYHAADESNVTWVRCRVAAVTHQFGVPLNEIPHGWKTVSVLAFDPAVPAMLADLPEADAWELHPSVMISTRETWEAGQASRTG